MTSVDNWLKTDEIKKNINFLNNGLSPSGLFSNNHIMLIKQAELHIIMPRENISVNLKNVWLAKLNAMHPTITLQITSVEEYLKSY